MTARPTGGEPAELIGLGRIAEVANDAVDEIMDRLKGRADVGSDLDSGIVDALNLLVNTMMHRLADPAASLEEIVREAYQESLSTILDWIEEA